MRVYYLQKNARLQMSKKKSTESRKKKHNATSERSHTRKSAGVLHIASRYFDSTGRRDAILVGRKGQEICGEIEIASAFFSGGDFDRRQGTYCASRKDGSRVGSIRDSERRLKPFEPSRSKEKPSFCQEGGGGEKEVALTSGESAKL